ncbi:MAG TPA: AAA family ATPase, partial [Fibrobacteria bacterium]|nr:AAA family ATPase [Fibrobacteria bacterium]
MLERAAFHQQIVESLRDFPIVAILGPRQCGKTTLSRALGDGHRFDLEDPTDLARLEDPVLALSALKGLVILDEIQRRPD